MASDIRVRLAPSPTGKLHIGTARTALFNYLFAKKHNGSFVVRIEDTDKERSNELFTKDILEGLLWLGLGWDEGPEIGGRYGPYFQQERLETYEQLTETLLAEKKAYRCYCSTEELEQERAAQKTRGEAPKYSGRCRHLTGQAIDQFEREGRRAVIRFAVEPQIVGFKDLIRGPVEFDAGLFGDFVVVRSDGLPLFLYSNVIDDHLMQISHVLRGEDHLVNTAKQILLNEALNFLSPEYGHFPLILNPDRSKMSKRKDPVSITDDFRSRGFLPEALVNSLALLGWSSGTDRELYSLKELVDEFELERVGKSPSIFDLEKLTWMNGHYIRSLPIGEIASRAQSFINDKKLFEKTIQRPDYFLEVVALTRDRIRQLDEIEELIGYFFNPPKYEAQLLIAKKSDKKRTLLALEAAGQALKPLKQFGLDETEKTLRQAAADSQLKDGELLWAVRVALSGKDASPGCFELLDILGKEESLKRLAAARRRLSS